MTKEEIKALVKAKIAGQGTMVDVGGALPKIIDGIVDLIPEASAGLGLSGVYTEGGNITIPEGTFAILAAGDYIVNEEEEIEVEEGRIDFYSADAGVVHCVGEITLGGSGLVLSDVYTESPEQELAVPEGTFAVFCGGPYQIELDDGDAFDLEAGQIAFVSKRNGEYDVEVGTVGSGPRHLTATQNVDMNDQPPTCYVDAEPEVGDIVSFAYIHTGEDEDEHGAGAVVTGFDEAFGYFFYFGDPAVRVYVLSGE